MRLPQKLADEILARRDQKLDEGSLPSETQLAQYYGTFRARFGPDQLSQWEGEELLNLLKDLSNHDSLTYWLEFKNDEDFPDIFGTIGGGSALNYGIYKRAETGLWMGGSSRKQNRLSIPEAVAIAKRHRDQLLASVTLLERLPQAGTDVDYQTLQQKLDDVAPDVSDSAWGHKYLSLLFPDKLEDFHTTYYQRYHLIKLQQLPPEVDGRYVVAGRFMAIARELEIPYNHLSSVLVDRHGRLHHYWKFLANYQEKGFDNDWPRMLTDGCISLAWREVGDLSNMARGKESLDEVKQRMKSAYNESGRWAREVYNFACVMNEGDVVLACEGSAILGIGKITGPVTYDNSWPTRPNHRAVEWLRSEPWQLPHQETNGAVRFVRNMANQVAIEEKLFSMGFETDPPIQPPTLKLEGIAKRIDQILHRKGQVILYGPPGTGKTYWARDTAQQLAAHSLFGKAAKNLTTIELESLESGADAPIQMSTFHPAYGYEDFIEGFRPDVKGDNLTFALRAGLFKRICRSATANPEKPFYLIIDEINRGDIPRIFGELLTLLEADKRGVPVRLPQSGEQFVVPPNVYVIGTMNTADRSIALLDTALRRRFGFIELMPNADVLKDTVIADSIPLGRWLTELNKRILAQVGSDARNLQIGHAYLLERGKPITTPTQFTRILHEDIIPLLVEYCYESFATLAEILGPELVDVKSQRIKDELFLPDAWDQLVATVRRMMPDIASDPTLVTAAENNDSADEGEDGAEEPRPRQ